MVPDLAYTVRQGCGLRARPPLRLPASAVSTAEATGAVERVESGDPHPTKWSANRSAAAVGLRWHLSYARRGGKKMGEQTDFVFDPVNSRFNETCGLSISEMRMRPDLAAIIEGVERRFGPIR